MDFHDLIGSFARSLGLREAKSEGENRYRFVFDGALDILCIEEGGKDLLIRANLGPLPEDDWECAELLRKMLGANIGLAGGRGFAPETVGLDSETGELFFFRRAGISDLSVAELSRIVERFLDCLEFLKGSLQGCRARPPSQSFILFP